MDVVSSMMVVGNVLVVNVELGERVLDSSVAILQSPLGWFLKIPTVKCLRILFSHRAENSSIQARRAQIVQAVSLLKIFFY